MMIMRNSSIDWDRLILPLKDTLEYLYTRLTAPVPAEILPCLERIPASRTELAEYKYKTENYQPKALGFLPVLWFRYLRLEGSDRPRHRFIGFVKYLLRFWGAEQIRQFPSYATFMAKRRIRFVSTSLIQSLFGAVAAPIARKRS